MAPKENGMCIVLAIVVMVWGGDRLANAQSQSSCTAALMGLTSCLNYVSGNSSSPSSSCCSSLSNIVQTQSSQCLCSLLNGGGNSYQGITINQMLALQLPGACNVQTPAISQCNAAANGPRASFPASPPSSSPAESLDNTLKVPTQTMPSTPSNPAVTGTGSKTVPSTNGSSSDGSNINAPLHLVVFVLFIVSSTTLQLSEHLN